MRLINSRETSRRSLLPKTKSKTCLLPSLSIPRATTAVCALLSRMPSSINAHQVIEGQLFASQFVDKLGTCFLPPSRDVGATDSEGVWLGLSDTTTARTSDDRLNDLSVE